MLKLNECEIDENNRPTREHKILKSSVLLNPFNDIKVRQSISKQKQPKLEKSKTDVKRKHDFAEKNITLLSFGDEVENEERILLPEKVRFFVIIDKQALFTNI